MTAEMNPIEFDGVNDHLVAPGAFPLPVKRTNSGLVSCWRIPLRRRLTMLFSGKVYLVVRGQMQPPCYVESEPPGDWFD